MHKILDLVVLFQWVGITQEAYNLWISSCVFFFIFFSMLCYLHCWLLTCVVNSFNHYFKLQRMKNLMKASYATLVVRVWCTAHQTFASSFVCFYEAKKKTRVQNPRIIKNLWLFTGTEKKKHKIAEQNKYNRR